MKSAKVAALLCVLILTGNPMSLNGEEQIAGVRYPDVVFSAEIVNMADGDEKSELTELYRRGWQWAYGVHFQCPPNPGGDQRSNAKIGFWVKGYIAGVNNGGESDMPARYVRYLTFSESGTGDILGH